MENEFGISRKSIRLWETQKDEIMNNSNKKNFRLPGGGRTSITKNHESEILIWLTTSRRYGIAISCNQIIAYAKKLIGKDFKFTYNAYQCWVKRFLQRHNLSIRRASHLGQKIMGPYINITYKFLINCIQKRKENKILDDISCIINVDETPIFFENPTKDTVDIKDKKK